MRVVVVILVFLFSFSAKAQNNYTITYQSGYFSNDSTQKLYLSYSPFELAIQDSVAYCYMPGLKKTVPVPLGSAYWPKSAFFKNGKEIYQQGYHDKPKTQRLVERTYKKTNWSFSDEEKLVLGYNCKKATGLINGKLRIIWYSEELPASFGPYIWTGLPGTALITVDIETGLVTAAIEIKKESLPIVEPTYCKRVREKDRK